MNLNGWTSQNGILGISKTLNNKASREVDNRIKQFFYLKIRSETMNREIKFRAWDGERLRNVGAIGWIDEELDYISTSKYSGEVDEDIVIMQYTGLKDKYGIEIFEGDVLAFEDDEFKWIVKYEYDSFFAVGGEHYRGEGLMEFYDWHEKRLDVVVRGNIYENPELLKENTDEKN